MSLIAFDNQSVPVPISIFNKSNITFFKPSDIKYHSLDKSINKKNNKINKNKNFSKIKHSGR